jgi:hypothetical protein
VLRAGTPRPWDPDTPTGHDPVLGDSASPESAAAAEHGAASARGRPRRRPLYAIVAAVVLAAAGTAGALLIPDHGDAPPTGGGRPAGGEFTAKAPWRLVVDDQISGDNVGCNVTMTNTGTGEPPANSWC